MKTKKARAGRGLGVGAFCLMTTTVSIWAAAAWSEEALTTEKAELQEVIVTARRQVENIQKVPLTVEAISAEELATKHVTDPGQIQFLAPAVQVTSFNAASGASNFSIRGIGTLSFSNLLEPAVATVIDGIVMGRPELGMQQFADVERIEVLEGPQGTLFGKNSTAGLINIITNSPKLDAFELMGHAEVGEVNAATHCCARLVTATVNAPVGADQALRLTGFYNGYGDLVEDVNANRDPHSNYGLSQSGGRLKYLWQATDALSINVAADYAVSTGGGSGAPTLRAISPNSIAYPFYQALGIIPSPDNLYRAANAVSNNPFQVGGAQAEVDYALNGGVTITDILGYRHYHGPIQEDADLLPINYFDNFYSNFNFDQLTNEIRLTGKAGLVDYQSGLYFLYVSSDRINDSTAALGITAPVPPGKVAWSGFLSQDKATTHSYAAYTQVTGHVSPALSLTGGVRVTHDRVGYLGFSDTSEFAIPLFPQAAKEELVTATDWSGRISAEYEFSPDTMGYVSAARGYKGPGFNSIQSGATPVGREHVTAYEVGVRSTMFDRRISLNLSLYDQPVKGLQVQSFDVTTLSYVVQNAAEMRARGVEAQLAFAATADLRFSLTAIYNDATYTDFVGGTCYPGQTAAQGCVNGLARNTGNSLENAPKTSGTVNADFEPAVAANLQAFFHADVYARSQVNYSANGDPGTREGGYAVVDANVGLGAKSGTWRASVYCRNCLDRRFVDFIEPYPFGVPGKDYWQTFGLNAFRTVGLSLDARF